MIILTAFHLDGLVPGSRYRFCLYTETLDITEALFHDKRQAITSCRMITQVVNKSNSFVKTAKLFSVSIQQRLQLTLVQVVFWPTVPAIICIHHFFVQRGIFNNIMGVYTFSFTSIWSGTGRRLIFKPNDCLMHVSCPVITDETDG